MTVDPADLASRAPPAAAGDAAHVAEASAAAAVSSPATSSGEAAAGVRSAATVGSKSSAQASPGGVGSAGMGVAGSSAAGAPIGSQAASRGTAGVGGCAADSHGAHAASAGVAGGSAASPGHTKGFAEPVGAATDRPDAPGGSARPVDGTAEGPGAPRSSAKAVSGSAGSAGGRTGAAGAQLVSRPAQPAAQLSEQALRRLEAGLASQAGPEREAAVLEALRSAGPAFMGELAVNVGSARRSAEEPGFELQGLELEAEEVVGTAAGGRAAGDAAAAAAGRARASSVAGSEAGVHGPGGAGDAADASSAASAGPAPVQAGERAAGPRALELEPNALDLAAGAEDVGWMPAAAPAPDGYPDPSMGGLPPQPAAAYAGAGAGPSGYVDPGASAATAQPGDRGFSAASADGGVGPQAAGSGHAVAGAPPPTGWEDATRKQATPQVRAGRRMANRLVGLLELMEHTLWHAGGAGLPALHGSSTLPQTTWHSIPFISSTGMLTTMLDQRSVRSICEVKRVVAGAGGGEGDGARDGGAERALCARQVAPRHQQGGAERAHAR